MHLLRLLHRCRAVTSLILGLLVAPLASAADTPPLRVVVSFSILADMVREVAGEAAVVSSLVGPNADAHAFEPSPAAVKQLAGADLVLVNGLNFEGWLQRMVRISGYRGPVVEATKGLRPRTLHGAADPHAWHDLAHARTYVVNIRDALAAAAPAQAALFQTRAAHYLQRLEELDQRTRAGLQAIPRDQRKVLTSHDAFAYLGEAYGITLLSPQGWTTGAEPSAGQVAKVIRQIRTQQVRALFVENISDPRLIQRIAAESSARVGGTLYSDALSAPGGPADTYLKLMAHNLDAIRAALAP
ncbi:MAG: zinc ABC transporter substrate-binding protein [Pseudomonadota bacterium]